MKAIIIAAGLGIRLNPLTNEQPKCMLEIESKTIMQRQLKVLKHTLWHKITFVGGYTK